MFVGRGCVVVGWSFCVVDALWVIVDSSSSLSVSSVAGVVPKHRAQPPLSPPSGGTSASNIAVTR